MSHHTYSHSVPRAIFHVDMDAFFASVEIVENPRLKGKPLIIGGDPNGRGVVSTCSYEARAYGVRSAMSMKEAVKLCPKGTILHGNFSLYRYYSEKVMKVLAGFTYKIEQMSVDEAYLEVTEIASNHGGAMALAKLMRSAVFETTGLTCSLGLASNKLIAKIASSMAKPNGILEIPPGSEKAFLSPLKIEKIPGIGPQSAARLHAEGVFLVKDLQVFSFSELMDRFGSRGYSLYQTSRGKDDREVDWHPRTPKSLSAETTFREDINDPMDLKYALYHLCKRVHRRLQSKKLRASTVSLKLRDAQFQTHTRSLTLNREEERFLPLLKTSLRLFDLAFKEGTPIRLIGIGFEKLQGGPLQLQFWDDIQSNL